MLSSFSFKYCKANKNKIYAMLFEVLYIIFKTANRIVGIFTLQFIQSTRRVTLFSKNLTKFERNFCRPFQAFSVTVLKQTHFVALHRNIDTFFDHEAPRPLFRTKRLFDTTNLIFIRD